MGPHAATVRTLVAAGALGRVENRTGGVARWRRAMDAEGLLIHASAGWSKRGAASPMLCAQWWRIAGFRGADTGPIRSPDRVAGHLVHPTIALADPRLRIHHAAIVAACRVIDVHQAEPECCPPWGDLHYTDAAGQLRHDVVHLVLAQRRALPNDGIPAKGRLGLWRPDPELLADVLDELGAPVAPG